jgi:ferredoxin-NADP reductase
MPFKARILEMSKVTHDVKRFVVEKPKGFAFDPGQACLISIDKPGQENEKRPFTMTSLKDDKHLEFIIKAYDNPGSVTKKLHMLKPGDKVILDNVFGTLKYRGPGVFIAGGTGITPFIAIFRQLEKDGKLEGNVLIFSNKTSKDIILEKELKKMLGNQFILTLTEERKKDYHHGFIDKKFLESIVKEVNQFFYVVGPPPMVSSIKKILEKMGVKKAKIIVEGMG